MSHAPPHLPECPIHVGCPIVGAQCACGEHWFGATEEVRQALRLGLLANDPFVVRLLQLEDVGVAFADAIASFTRNGDDASMQLGALAVLSPASTAAFLTRQATGAPLPGLRLADANHVDRRPPG